MVRHGSRRSAGRAGHYRGCAALGLFVSSVAPGRPAGPGAGPGVLDSTIGIPSPMPNDLVVLYEHPEWQKPLFAALQRRGVRFARYDLKNAAFDPGAPPEAPLYFNQASPSAYVRGNARALPFALSLMRSLELGGARVLNGSRAFALELSKSAQAALMRSLG